jgi:hypothetical protein
VVEAAVRFGLSQEILHGSPIETFEHFNDLNLEYAGVVTASAVLSSFHLFTMTLSVLRRLQRN